MPSSLSKPGKQRSSPEQEALHSKHNYKRALIATAGFLVVFFLLVAWIAHWAKGVFETMRDAAACENAQFQLSPAGERVRFASLDGSEKNGWRLEVHKLPDDTGKLADAMETLQVKTLFCRNVPRLDWLSGLTCLETVYADGNKELTSIRGLANLKRLRHLDISNTNVVRHWVPGGTYATGASRVVRYERVRHWAPGETYATDASRVVRYERDRHWAPSGTYATDASRVVRYERDRHWAHSGTYATDASRVVRYERVKDQLACKPKRTIPSGTCEDSCRGPEHRRQAALSSLDVSRLQKVPSLG